MKFVDALLLLSLARLIIRTVVGWIEDLKARGELTPEQRAAYRAEMDALFTAEHWEPRPLARPPTESETVDAPKSPV